ncbi:DNRLRE domain-containing protein [Actinopolymorpha alba]|uniref:DNRLRE domain-containing protein n=1 Tax=Actinopolymorpha alba TaxID=533267 RepID=UPI0003646739|nr:DNRLRE domain-containing protein [Actinopolymorpha alba]
MTSAVRLVCVTLTVLLVASVLGGVGSVVVSGTAQAASKTPLKFVPLDRMTSLQTLAMTSGQTAEVQVTGRATVPSNAKAVLLDLTVSKGSAATQVTVWTGGTRPVSANLTAPAATTVQNSAAVEVSDAGSVQVFNESGTLTVALAVQGYFVDDGPSTPGGFVATKSTRLLDTRKTARIPAGGTLDVRIAGVSGVPRDASSVFVNLIVEKPGGSGAVGIYKKGVAPTGAGPVFFSGRSVAQTINVAPDVNGYATVKNFSSTGPMDVIVDVQGYFTGSPANGNPFNPVATQVYDSRNTGGSPVPGGGVRTIQVAGVGGLPADGISAVFANVTVISPSSLGGIHVWNPDEPEPGINNVVFQSGVNQSTMIAAKVSADGKLAIGNRGTGDLHVVVDIQGWFSGPVTVPASDGGEYRPLQHARIVDTKNGTGGYTGTIGPNKTRSFKVTGVGGVPSSGVSAVALMVTATDPSANSWITVWPTGEPRPNVSQVSVGTGSAVSNTVIAKVGAGGQVDVFNRSGAVNVLVDVQGYYTDSTAAKGGGTFVPVDLPRIYDTGSGTGGSTTPLTGGETREVQVSGVGGVPASGVVAVAVNLSVASPSTDAELTAFASGSAKPAVTTLNATAGADTSTLAQVKVGADGKIAVSATGSGQMRLMIDVEGYYLDKTQISRELYVPLSPRRIYTSATDFIAHESRSIRIAGAKDSEGNVVIPATEVTTVVVSITATHPAGKGSLRAWRFLESRPDVTLASYNVVGADVTATAIVRLGGAGFLDIQTTAAAGITVDVLGYFQASKLTPVVLATPSLIYSTGAELKWTAYHDESPDDFDDLDEYQLHRSVNQNFTPSAATLVAPIKKDVTTFTDETARPTPADDPDPFGTTYYYVVAVKTKDRRLTHSKHLAVRLPKAGRITRVLQGPEVATDTTLTSGQPSAAHDVLDGKAQLMTGNDSPTYGNSRAAVRFDISQIPADVVVTDSELSLWTIGASEPAGAVYQAHKLTRGFNQATATWNNADTSTAWTSPGGDFVAEAAGSLTGVAGQVPTWRTWRVTDAVKDWYAAPSTNHGLLLKLADETGPAESTRFMSTEAAAPSAELRPKLAVTYLERTAQSTYYIPDTPNSMREGGTYSVDVTLSNPTTSTWLASDWVMSYRWAWPDDTDATNSENQLQTAISRDLGSGETMTMRAQVKAPILEPGNLQVGYWLKWELFNKATGKWLSETEQIPSLDQVVGVS